MISPDPSAGVSGADLLAGAAITAGLAFLGWLAKSMSGLNRRFDRFDTALFGDERNPEGGLLARVKRVEGRLHTARNWQYETDARIYRLQRQRKTDPVGEDHEDERDLPKLRDWEDA